MSPLHDLPAAAKILGLSVCTLRRAVRVGKVPHRRLGGVIRFTEDDLAEYVEACRIGVRGVPEPRVKMGPLKWVAPPPPRLRPRRPLHRFLLRGNDEKNTRRRWRNYHLGAMVLGQKPQRPDRRCWQICVHDWER